MRAFALAVIVSLACGSNDSGSRTRGAPANVGTARDGAASDAGDATMMFIEIEGTLAELAALRAIDGLELERGAKNIGGGRHKVGAFVRKKGALLDIQARGLTTHVVMDEEEAKRRIENERAQIRKSAAADAGTDAPTQQAPTDQTKPTKPKAE